MCNGWHLKGAYDSASYDGTTQVFRTKSDSSLINKEPRSEKWDDWPNFFQGGNGMEGSRIKVSRH